MLNFDNIVKSVLLEQDPAAAPGTPTPNPGASQQQVNMSGNYPAWFKSILDHHKKLGLGEPKEAEVRQLFNIAFKPYVSEQDAAQAGKNILILDVIKVIYDSVNPKPQKTQDSFFQDENVNKAGEVMAKKITSYTQKNQWQIENAFVANAYKGVSGNRMRSLQSGLQSLFSATGQSLYVGS